MRRVRQRQPVETPLQAAARWALLLEEGPLNACDQRVFTQWLDADPAHAAVFRDCNWALNSVARHAAAPELIALRSAALSIRKVNRPRVWLRIGASSVLAASIAVAFFFSPLSLHPFPFASMRSAAQPADSRTAVYSTAIGDRAAITLPDGSIVTLDTDSALRVAFDGLERGVHLLRGQALFDVAKAKIPFAVHARDQRIIAVGTIFNVRVDPERVKVALVQGVVRVRTVPARAAASGQGEPTPVKELVMTAGDVLEAEGLQQVVLRREDVGNLASWQRGMLVFNDARLSDAVAEVNRYTTRPIAIADASIGSARVSGVFRSNDPERFAYAMAEILPVTVTIAPDGSLTLRERTH
jgi:transmembrane sensor